MIKVILVEDDKLVRKSLITSFDWEKFNMEIVGDAKNGEKALELLEKHEVDLIITDLAMPIMSGIDLIRKVKVQYPSMFIVILSLHQDFEYIQEAMRLGVIDYIAKVELDTEYMNKTLERIHDRILEEQTKQQLPYHNMNDEIRNGAILISEKNIESYSKIISLSPFRDKTMFIGTDALLVSTNHANQFNEILQMLASQTDVDEPLLLIHIENNKRYRREELIHMIQKHKEYFYFYEIKKGKKITTIGMEDLVVPSNDKNLQDHKIEQIKEKLKSLRWVFDDIILINMLQEINELRLTNHKLKELLVINIGECQRLYSFALSNDIELADSYSCWHDVENWFWDTKQMIYHSVYRKSISKETNASIFEAIYHIEENLTKNLTTTEISNKVHMSRSYFCLCFKDVVGKTFNEYVQSARISKAIHYLTYTNNTISIISEKVGYVDPKYFSKIFKKVTGLLPSEYKKRYHEV